MEWRASAEEVARTLLSASAQDLGAESERLARNEQLSVVDDIHVRTAARRILLRRESPLSSVLTAIGGLVAGAGAGYLPSALGAQNVAILVATLVATAVGLVIFTIGIVMAVLRK